MRAATTRIGQARWSFFPLVALLLCSFDASSELLAGAGKESIVPPFPTHMGGYGDRLQPFEGVHDELYARALVLDDGETRLCVIGSGLMAFDEELAAGVRKTVSQKTPIPPENILVSCAHNHSAPSYYQYESEEEMAEVRDFFIQRFSDAAVAAWESRRPAEIGYRNGEIRGATNNRQQSNEEVIDTQVGVLRVEEKEGRSIIAILFNFTGHPVIQGSENLLLSGEWPGAASRTVEQALGGVAVFTQGACGDITVHRSGDPWLEIERLGRLVAGEVIKTAEFIRPVESARLASAYVEVPLDVKRLPDPDEAEAELETLQAELQAVQEADRPRELVRHYERRIRLLRALHRQAEALARGELERPEYYTGSVHVMQIGDLVLVGIPGELFVEYALEMRQRTYQMTGKNFILVGYANGYIGYIVTPRAMRTGGYEASVARVNEDAGRILTERAMGLIATLVH